MAQGLVVGCLVKKSAIKAVFENRTDRGDGANLDLDAASAGGIDARVVVDPGQRQDAEAGTKASLGMRPCSDDVLEKRRDSGTDPLAGCDQPSRASICRSGGGRSAYDRRWWYGHADWVHGRRSRSSDLCERSRQSCRRCGHRRVHGSGDKGIRGGIPMAIDLDVIVGATRQRFQRGSNSPGSQRTACQDGIASESPEPLVGRLGALAQRRHRV